MISKEFCIIQGDSQQQKICQSELFKWIGPCVFTFWNSVECLHTTKWTKTIFSVLWNWAYLVDRGPKSKTWRSLFINYARGVTVKFRTIEIYFLNNSRLFELKRNTLHLSLILRNLAFLVNILQLLSLTNATIRILPPACRAHVALPLLGTL